MCHTLSMTIQTKLYILAMVISAAMTGAGLASPSSATAEPASYALTVHSVAAVYRYPDTVLSARRDCYRAERAARGIPGGTEAYVAWWDAHAGTAERASWSAAFDACNDANPLPGGPWNWSAMVRVR